MKTLIAIDGSPGTGKSTIARLVAERLGWPLTGNPEETDSSFAVIEGKGVLSGENLNLRGRFYLDAAPEERPLRLADTPDDPENSPDASARLAPETILIDTTGIEPPAIAAMIAALASDEKE